MGPPPVSRRFALSIQGRARSGTQHEEGGRERKEKEKDAERRGGRIPPSPFSLEGGRATSKKKGKKKKGKGRWHSDPLSHPLFSSAGKRAMPSERTYREEREEKRGGKKRKG